MKCKKYPSKEAYYGVDNEVPPMTSSFWDCEPEDEEIREAFLKWMYENGEFLEKDFPKQVKLYCEDCDEWLEFNYIPADVFTDEELYEINSEAAKKWLIDGEIDEDDYEYIMQDLEKLLKNHKKEEKWATQSM